MVENNSNEKELDKESPEYKFGYSFGTVAAHVVAAGLLALFVVVIMKLIRWVWLL